MRPMLAAALLALTSLTAASAETVPTPLNDHTRLGQRFTTALAFDTLAVTVPSWSDAEGGLTLTLWDSLQRTKALGRQAFVDIRDNAAVSLSFAEPLPAGTYYWEVSDRTGKTRVGLYADVLGAETDDCTYLDGKPDRTKRFRFSTTPVAFPYTSAEQMLAVITSDAPEATRIEAARQLAAMGGAEAIPGLARLLANEKLSHLARFALQAMPGPAASTALRDALPMLKGERLVGAINSIGERRDTEAVGALRSLLTDAGAQVASAAAVALGKIGTADAGKALQGAMAGASADVRPAVHEGALQCAQRLAEDGRRTSAAALYDALRRQETSPAVRTAAMRGAIVARGTDALPLLLKQLESDDQAMVEVALWVIARNLLETRTTQFLAAELPRLPAEKQAMLAGALCSRGDVTALPPLIAVARNGEKSVRLAVIQGLRQIPHPTVTAVLMEALGDPDADIANAAQAVLSKLWAEGVNAAVAAAVEQAEKPARLRAIQLVSARRLWEARPQVLAAARDDDKEIRLAALKVLEELAGADEAEALLDLVVNAASAEDRETAERALLAAYGRTPDAGARAGKLTALLPQAQPALKQALLRLLHGVGGSAAGRAILAAVDDADAAVKATAIRLLGEWRTARFAPALLRLAATSTDADQRLQCLRSYLRLAGNKRVSLEDKLFICRMAAPLMERDEERKLLLGMLGGLPTVCALPLATPHLEAPATREEAGAAILAIAEKLAAGPDGAKTIESLQKVVQSQASADLVKRAKALLTKLNAPAP